MPFEWDPVKNEINIAKHEIDFEDVKRVFDAFVIEYEVIRNGEKRVCAIGSLDGVIIFVVYVWRKSNRRIISARIARRSERGIYNEKNEN